MQTTPSIVTVLDTRRAKKSGKYPVKLRITFAKKQKYYPIGIDVTKENYGLMQSLAAVRKNLNIHHRRELEVLEIKCNKSRNLAYDIISNLPLFSFAIFEKKYLTSSHQNGNVFQYYLRTIQKLKQEGRIGTANCYSTSMNSIKRFSANLKLSEITADFIKKYETWLLNQKYSITTVGIYIRPLRAIINQAIEDGELPRELYPFGKRRYHIPASNNNKKALTIEELRRLCQYSAEPYSWYDKAKDMFLFSYYGNGMNMKDVLKLKWKNIDGDFVRFIRSKTSKTNRSNQIVVSFSLTKHLQIIIEKWGNKSGEYIFPVLSIDITPEKELATIQQFIKMINKYLGLICKSQGIDKKVTTYYARHTFATILKWRNVNVMQISEALGHSSLKTTEYYLASFDDSSKKEMAKLLIV